MLPITCHPRDVYAQISKLLGGQIDLIVFFDEIPDAECTVKCLGLLPFDILIEKILFIRQHFVFHDPLGEKEQVGHKSLVVQRFFVKAGTQPVAHDIEGALYDLKNPLCFLHIAVIFGIDDMQSDEVASVSGRETLMLS